MKFLCRLLLMIIIGSATVQAQNKKISGTILSKTDNFPVIGATVVEKGNPTNGVISNLDGEFTISVAPNAELTFSYVGYKSVTLPATDGMNVIWKKKTSCYRK